MGYWLLVYLFTAEGEFMAKDVYETASREQCVAFAGEVAKTIVDTKLQAQFYCLDDDQYRQSIGVDQ